MRKETKKPSFAKASEGREKEFGEGEVSLEDIPFVGGLLKGLEKFIDLAERVEQAGGEIRKSGTIKGLGGNLGRNKGVRGIYGFTVRTGLGQKTKVEPFGNIKKTKAGPRVMETREPIVDVFDEKDHILIIAELPGIDEKSIKIDFKKDILLLEAGGGNRKYSKEILLKDKIDFDSRETSFKNGILELRLKKI